MSLDLSKVSVQVAAMISRLKSGAQERQEHLERAFAILQSSSDNLDRLKQKIAASKTTWLVAGLVDGLDSHLSSPSIPADYTVIAADGSHMDVDRHRAARCCLINIGSVMLKYGARPEAVLESYPQLYFKDEDLVIPSPTPKERDQPIEGPLLGIKRSVEECRRLAELAAGAAPGPALALLDGTLILWNLEAYPDFVVDALLKREFLGYLDAMARRPIALASHISFPRSTDVVNVLRVATCPHDIADCDRYCAAEKSHSCDFVSGILDRDLFNRVLSPGERSALFSSPSRVVAKHYREHQVYFFYLNVDDEIARIEVPRWVAASDDMLNLAHALILDQCRRRGQGYPVALAEAHEQAVVTGTEREYFWQMVESSLADERMPHNTSTKSLSKRTRWV